MKGVCHYVSVEPHHHDTASTVFMALVANGAIAVLKFGAAFLSGSAAMLAEAFHSLADTGNQLFLLLGIRSSRRPPDRNHPFGYGKDSFFWAFVVAVSMFTMGAVISLYEGVKKILEPHPIHGTFLLISGIVIVAAMVFEAFAFHKAWKQLRTSWQEGPFWEHVVETKNSALLTVFFEDTAALVGLWIALVGLAATWITGYALWDGLSSVVIGLLLAFVAFFLARESRGLLLGERASTEIIEYIHHRLEETAEILDFEPVKTMQIGANNVLATTLLRVRPDLTVEEIDALTDQLEHEVREAHPSVRHLYFEVKE